MSYDGWAPYVSAAQRRANAAREIQKLRKKGTKIEPIEVRGRKIARTFWGQAWCNHLEKFSDYANRLPRGRTYVRNGSVCHLAISKGKVEAIVSGSELYDIKISITPLSANKWKNVRKQCAGQIGSMLELLRGRFSDNVMQIVTDQDSGLFPKPSEITLACDCRDWAEMCKHIAAVLYGVGARLDQHPELLFLLRTVGVEHVGLWAMRLHPIYHHKALRTEGHLFIIVMAYQLVQVIRRDCGSTGRAKAGPCLRRILNGQQRITATFRRADQCALHVRKATVAEPAQREIYQALGISETPGGTQKTIIEPRKKYLKRARFSVCSARTTFLSS